MSVCDVCMCVNVVRRDAWGEEGLGGEEVGKLGFRCK